VRYVRDAVIGHLATGDGDPDVLSEWVAEYGYYAFDPIRERIENLGL
jgi:hypothetical protein